MNRKLSVSWLAVFCISVCAWMPEARAAKKPLLVMFEQWGCEWCEVWNEEIGQTLPKTAEGKCTAFSRIDIHESDSELLKNIKPVVFTPTFVVFEDGKEVGRIVGYAGEEFFWPQLASHLNKLSQKCELTN
ncbi:MAG: thioredoxin fold domain-containing protein [Pseudomonadota bacterium]